jgi:hypothetical protein
MVGTTPFQLKEGIPTLKYSTSLTDSGCSMVGKKSSSNVFEPEPNLNLRFKFGAQQMSEPERKFEFGVQRK